jgi:nitrate/nitrite transporter NarK
VKIIREIFTGVGGSISSKRVMMFFSFIVMIFMAILSTFYEKKVEQFIFDGFLYIVVGGLFSVASEQFASKFRKMEQRDYYEEINDNDIIDEPLKRKRRNL